MILEKNAPGGKKRRTIKNITDDLTRGAWNNLDLSRSSKRAIFGAASIILIGGIAAANLILKKK
jgi:hypothetical protein